jgi:uncharacterized protein (DUF1697 family)
MTRHVRLSPAPVARSVGSLVDYVRRERSKTFSRAPGPNLSAPALVALGNIKGPETARAHGRQVYVVYPNDIGRSRLTNTLLEDKVGIRGTARDWNTVLKLAALANK